MKYRLAALDANVLIFMAERRPTDDTRFKRWTQVQATMRELLGQGTELIIPTPSLAELYAGSEDGYRVAVQLEKQGRHVRFEAFDDQAARIAGRITRARLSQRAPASAPTRNTIKFDAMIVGTAVAAGADCLVTTDPADMVAWTAFLGDEWSLAIIDASAPPGQLSMLE